MIYFIQSGTNGPIKIGQSDNPEERMAQLQIGCPYKLKLIWVYKGADITESELHAEFGHERIRGEWFRPSKKIFRFMSEELGNYYEVELNDNKTIGISEDFRFGIDIHYDRTTFLINDSWCGVESNLRVGLSPRTKLDSNQ